MSKQLSDYTRKCCTKKIDIMAPIGSRDLTDSRFLTWYHDMVIKVTYSCRQ